MQDEGRAPLSQAPTPQSPDGPDRTQLLIRLGAVAAVVLLLDQGTKIWALASLEPGRPVQLLGDALQLRLIRNPGAAFSIGHGATWVLTLIATVVLVFIGVTARRLASAPWAIALGLLLGGSLGNLIDRMLRPPAPGRGHVVDFIDYSGLFIGNVADIAIVGAAVFIVVLSVRGYGVDGSRPHVGRHEAPVVSGQVHADGREGELDGERDGEPGTASVDGTQPAAADRARADRSADE